MTALIPAHRRDMLKALLGFLVWPGLPLRAAAQAERLPLRNLRVEIRQGEAARLEGDGAALEHGAVTVDADGRVVARAGVSVEAGRRASQRQADQQLLVLNGGQAALRVGVTMPVYWVQWVWSGGQALPVLGSRWVDTGRSVWVRPRWPGGAAPVTLELRADVAAPATGGLPRAAPDGVPPPPGSVETAGLLTTLSLPLDTWLTVASSGESAQSAERGLLSTRALAGSRRHLVQMRVSLP